MSTAPDAAADAAGEPESGRHLAVAPAPDEPDAPGDTGDAAGGDASTRSLSDRLDRAVDRALAKVAWASPPDVVRFDRPGLAKLWRHARYGSYAGGTHITRVLGVCWAFLALAYTAWVYGKAWLVERPTRAGVAVGVLAVVAATPPGRAVLTVLLWLPHHVISLLTTF